MKKIQNKHKINVMIIIAIATSLFMILFNKFIFHEYAYVFSIPGDWAIDSMNSYYPALGFMSNSLHGNGFDLYTLESGLGTNMSYIYSYFGNPIDLIAILFPLEYLHDGILVATYFKILIISLVGFKYFEMLHKDKSGVFISTIAWTFCSYVLIWGEHYVFCTQMMNFTIFMFFLHKWLIGQRNSIYILIPFMSFFLINNFYFFYMSGIFSVFYVIFYELYLNRKCDFILKQIITLGMSAMLSIGIAAVIFLPIIYMLLNSPRGDTLFSIDNVFKLLEPYNFQFLATYIARFLNPNLIGDGYQVAWSGALNYYEAAFLSSSMLSLFTIVYEITCGKNRRLSRLIIVIMLVLLIFPIFTYAFTFNSQAQRWTYLIIFVNCICLGNVVHIVKNSNVKKIKKISYISFITLIAMIFILLISESFTLINVHYRVLLFVIIFSVCYYIILVSRRLKHKTKLRLLTVVIMSELVIINYPALNNRGIEREPQFRSRYEDGTIEAVSYLKNIDTSLYRISKSYTSVFLNDSMRQFFNGFNSYSSVNSKELWDTAANYGGKQSGHPNYVEFNNPLFQNILGSKYQLSKELISGLNIVDNIDGIYIYENKYDIPFGFMYDRQFKEESFNELTVADKVVAMTQGFIINQEVNIPVARPEIVNSYIDARNYISGYVNCTGDLLNNKQIEAKGNDMQIILDFQNEMNTSDSAFDRIEVDLNIARDSIFQIYFDTDNGFNEQQSIRSSLHYGKNYLQIPLDENENIKKIRIDPVTDEQNIEIERIDFVIENQEQMSKSINRINNNGVKNASFENSVFKGTVDNTDTTKQMLMVPISYDDNWKAELNNELVDTYNINHGFIGIIIPSGEYEITLKYSVPYLMIGLTVSVFSIIIYIILLIYHKCRKKS